MKRSFWQRFKGSAAHTQVSIVCTILVMIATITYTIIAGFQLRALNGQIELMRGTLAEQKRSGEQSTEQMWSAIGNINWMARSVDWSQKQSQKSLDASLRQFREDQRPYIGQTSKSTEGPHWVQTPNDSSRGQIVWDWHMTNYGKSPANKVWFTQEMKLSGDEWDSTYGANGVDKGPPQVQGQDVFDSVISKPLQNEDFAKLLNITEGISIRIKIHYSGPDGTKYKTGLCLTRTNAGSIAYCRDDNYIK